MKPNHGSWSYTISSRILSFQPNQLPLLYLYFSVLSVWSINHSIHLIGKNEWQTNASSIGLVYSDCSVHSTLRLTMFIQCAGRSVCIEMKHVYSVCRAFTLHWAEPCVEEHLRQVSVVIMINPGLLRSTDPWHQTEGPMDQAYILPRS